MSVRVFLPGKTSSPLPPSPSFAQARSIMALANPLGVLFISYLIWSKVYEFLDLRKKQTQNYSRAKEGYHRHSR